MQMVLDWTTYGWEKALWKFVQVPAFYFITAVVSQLIGIVNVMQLSEPNQVKGLIWVAINTTLAAVWSYLKSHKPTGAVDIAQG